MSDTAPQPYRLPRRIGIAEAVRRCLRQFLTFSGRAPRAEFWKFLLALALAQIALIVIKTVTLGPAELTAPGPDGQPVVVRVAYDSGLAGRLLMIAAFLPMLAAGWRRLHDRNLSGWWLLAPVALQLALTWGAALVLIGPWVLWSAFRDYGNVSFNIGGAPGLILALASIAMWIALIVTLSRRGTLGPNRFGPNPLEVTA